MSDLDAYRSLYVAESRENHEAIVSNLLILEQGTDSHAIDEIFRAAHSLKGMSASMGFMHMEEITHALEDVFSQIRSGNLTVSQVLIDDLLAGVDDIEAMIDDIEEGGDGLLEHKDMRVAALKAWIEGNEPKKETKPEPPQEESGFDMYENPSYIQYDQAGCSSFQIHLEVADTVDSKNLRSMLLLQNLEAIGKITAISPERGIIEDDESFPGIIDLTVQSNAGREAIETILSISDIKTSAITENTIEDATCSSPEAAPGTHDYQIHIEISSAVDSKNLRSMLLLQNLEAKGEIRSLAPPRKTIEDDPAFSGSIELRLCSAEERGALEQILTTSDVASFGISGDEREEPERREPVYQIHIEISPAVDSKNLRSMLLLQNLEAAGKITSISPKREVIEDSPEFSGVIDLSLESTEDLKKLEGFLQGSDIKAYTVNNQKGSDKPDQAQQVGREPTDRGKVPAVDKIEKKREVKNIRVDIDRLDHMMNLVEDLVINRGRLEQIAQNYKIKELDETLNMVGRSVADLQVLMMDIRMIPLNQIFNRFPRTVRDIATNQKKEVEFIVEGGDTELDRSVLDGLNDPLLHLIRNALDHGIEPPEVRINSGKNPKGILKLSASRDKDNVIIVIEDDGAGINVEKIKKKALERGLISEENAASLSDTEAYDLLFLPGFSTADKITDISGRGVGLDVVKTTINSLQGTIKIDSAPGEGTRFELVLPPTMAIVMVMMIRINNRRCAIPITNVAEVASLAAFPIQNIGHGEGILMRDEIIVLYRLDDMFGRSKNEEILVVLQNQSKKGAIIADLIEGQQEVVIKPLSKFVGACEGVSGVTIPGDGEVVPVLDIKAILKEGGQRGSKKKNSRGRIMTNNVIIESDLAMTEQQADELRELGNIGAAHAATTLSTILNTMINIRFPQIILVNLENLNNYMDDIMSALIVFKIQGQVGGEGYIIIHIPKPSIIRLTNIMIGKADEEREIDEMDRSALNEIGNIMTSSFLDACATLLGIIMLPSPPFMVIDMPHAALESIIATQEIEDNVDQVVLFKTEMKCAEHDISADIILLPSRGMLSELFARLESVIAMTN